jgi:hypothetical protein
MLSIFFMHGVACQLGTLLIREGLILIEHKLRLTRLPFCECPGSSKPAPHGVGECQHNSGQAGRQYNRSLLLA